MRKPFIKTALVVCVLAATACSSTAPSSASAAATPAATASPAIKGGTMTVRLSSAWNTFDPQISPNAGATQVSQTIFDKLIDVADGKIVPYLATSWTQTATSITFTVRKDASCSDGTPVTPSLIVKSLSRVTKESPQAGRLFGKGPYTLTNDDAASTVTLSVGTPYGDMLYGFTYANTGIICPASLVDPKELQTKAVGSGPFVIESAIPNDSITFKVRSDWKWGPNGTSAANAGFPERLIYKLVENDTTVANLLLTGGMDVTNVVGPDLQRLLADQSLIHKEGRTFGAIPLVFNETPGRATADIKVRQALITAIDQKEWNQAAYSGRGVVTPSYLIPGADCYEDTSSFIPKASTDAAKKVLTDAGYTVGPSNKLVKDGKTVQIKLLASPLWGKGPDYIFAQWQAAGIDVTLANLDFNTYFSQLSGANFDAAVQLNASSLPTMGIQIPYMTGPVPPAGLNFARILDPAVDKEIDAASRSSGNERCDHWKTAQRLLAQNYDLLPLSAPITDWFSRGIEFVAPPQVVFASAWSLRRVK